MDTFERDPARLPGYPVVVSEATEDILLSSPARSGPRLHETLGRKSATSDVAQETDEGNSLKERPLRIAVLLHGVLCRSLRHVVESMRGQLFAPLERLGQVDVFFHSWDVREIHNPRGGERGVTVARQELAEWLPEAKGVFESQEEFDRSVDWERLFARNPMRNCCDSEEEARATLMNFRRALESQERAWRVFEENKTRSYDVVVATRADLRYLEEGKWETLVPHLKNGGQECPPSLLLPRFHSWGGVNDRFAIGNEEGIRIWSNRVAFAEEWLERANGESSEWMLKQWLEQRRVRVGFLDFTFQRVRANGEVAQRDRDLMPAVRTGGDGGCGQNARATVRERFLILAREAGERAESLRRVLEALGRVEVVVDRPVQGKVDVGTGISSHGLDQDDRATVWIPDEEAEGFGGLMGGAGFPRITAWSRAMLHLARTLEDDEAVWFVEDDVAGDAGSFAALIAATGEADADLTAIDVKFKHEDGEWYWWRRAGGHFEEPCRAFQPLCRVSARLLRKVLEFREAQGGFLFHELLFASLARRHGMKCLDWRSEPHTKRLFADFRYRPEVRPVEPGISHPVKDSAVHAAVCAAPPAELPRKRVARCEGSAILIEDYVFLARYCRTHAITRVWEFGPGDSTLAFLDAGCRVISFEHDFGWLGKAAGRFGCEDRVELIHCPEGETPDVGLLPFVPDLVFVDGPPWRENQVMSRLPQCLWALDVCGCFVLHDANREAERATLAEMERRGMQVTSIPTRKGLAIVVDPQRRPEMIPKTAGERLQRYRTTKPGGWFARNFCAWSILLHESSRPVRVLEIGAWDGVSLNLMLDVLFPHPESEAHGVDLYQGVSGVEAKALFESNAAAGGHASRLHLYEGTGREILAWMIAGEGYWESFDFIHLDRASDAAELLADACQAWALLKPGGVMVLEIEESSAAGVTAFRSVFEDLADVLLDGGPLALVRRG